MNRPLVPRWEYWLYERAALALILALHFRLAWGYFTVRSFGLQDSWMIAAGWLLASLAALGSLVPRRYASAPAVLLGSLCWLSAVTMLPRDWWWLASPILRGDKALWALMLAVAMLILGILVRFAVRRRTLRAITGLGRQRMVDWATEQPFYPRMLVKRVLRNLGYDA